MKAHAKITSNTGFIQPAMTENFHHEQTTKKDLNIHFENGLVGFAQYLQYRLIDFDNPLYSPLKILANPENSDFSLMLMDLKDNKNFSFNTEDLTNAPFEYLENSSHVGCYIILTIRKPGDELLFTANTRAPIFVSYLTGQAQQFILPPKYSYSEPLNEFSHQVRERRALLRH